MGTAVIIVLFQLYQACAVTRRGENGFSEKDKVNTTTVFKKKGCGKETQHARERK